MDIEWVKALAPVGTLLVGTAGFYLAWKSRRESQLRQADVLKWSLETIRLLQEVVLAADRGCSDPNFITEEFRKALSTLGDALSVAAEQGRLFFRNIPNPHGDKKEQAYRGLRPEILDQLIIAAQICREFEGNTQQRRQLRYLALRAEQRFVSLAQLEVGRARVSSIAAGASGSGVHLGSLISGINSHDMERSEDRFRP